MLFERAFGRSPIPRACAFSRYIKDLRPCEGCSQTGCTRPAIAAKLIPPPSSAPREGDTETPHRSRQMIDARSSTRGRPLIPTRSAGNTFPSTCCVVGRGHPGDAASPQTHPWTLLADEDGWRSGSARHFGKSRIPVLKPSRIHWSRLETSPSAGKNATILKHGKELPGNGCPMTPPRHPRDFDLVVLAGACLVTVLAFLLQVRRISGWPSGACRGSRCRTSARRGPGWGWTARPAA